jgi:glycosyltransferase involved in cell wall biosynthesis
MITHSLGLEGAPRHLVNVAKGLAATGGFNLAVFSHVDGPLRPELVNAGIPVHIAPHSGRVPDIPSGADDLTLYVMENLSFLKPDTDKDMDEVLRKTAAYLTAVLEYRPDLIIANTVLAFWAVALARRWNIPAIWCIHESEKPFIHLQCLPKKLHLDLPNLLKSAAQVVFVSRATLALFKSLTGDSNFTVIHCGLPPDMPIFEAQHLDRQTTRKRLGIRSDVISVLVLGTVFERKGQMDICRAMALLPEKLLEKVCCHIVGDRLDTPYSLALHGYIKGLPERVREAIRVFPETPDTAPHYRAADVFVMCSRMESYPLVILEAMSLGLPIITTPVFGIREQLTEQSALFYEPGDVEKLAAHISRLAKNTTARITMGNEALRRYAKLPSHADMISAYHSVITRLSAPPRT